VTKDFQVFTVSLHVIVYQNILDFFRNSVLLKANNQNLGTPTAKSSCADFFPAKLEISGCKI